MSLNKLFLFVAVAAMFTACNSPAGSGNESNSNIINNSKLTVIFNSNGGSSVTSLQVERGKTVAQPTDPKKDGYIFLGWYYGENIFDFSTPISSTITLSAKWKPITYKISFNKNGASGQELHEISLAFDEEITLPINIFEAPVGMKFAGWSKSSCSTTPLYSDGQTIKNLTNENNTVVILYAIWIDKTGHTIRYENLPSEETIDNSENPLIYYESENVNLANIERVGYTFDGWFTDSNCSDNNKITGWKSGEQTTDLVLYAKWSLINFNITYEGLNGATNPNKTTYTVLDKWYIEPISKDGYSFKGWKNGDNKITFISEAGGKDITLTAQWEIENYGIVYNLSTPDGTNHKWCSDSTFTIEQDVTLEENPANKPYFLQNYPNLYGYNFLGWFENKNYTGTAISGWNKGQKKELISLYGKFEPKTCSISFNSCGGTNITNQTAIFDTYVTKPEDPVYNDYSFIGWYYDTEKTLPFDFSKKFKDTEDITLYAKWGMLVYVEGATVEKNLTNVSIDCCFTGGGNIKIRNLYVSDHEITQAEYTKYCKYSKTKPSEDPYMPVSNVSFYDAIIYCNLRSIAEGLEPVYYYFSNSSNYIKNPTEWPFIKGDEESKYCGNNSDVGFYWRNIHSDSLANGYRLPTEAEWEYIAREGSPLSTYTYSGSNKCGEVAWYKDNSNNKLHYGKCKKPNFLKIYDMSGNISELCWQSRNSKARGDIDDWVIVRGGNYSSYTHELDNGRALNDTIQPYRDYDSIGFRVVRTATE